MSISSAFMAGRMAMAGAGMLQGAVVSLALAWLLPQIVALSPLPITLICAATIWLFLFQMVWNGHNAGRLAAICTIATSFYGIICWHVLKGDDANLRGAMLASVTIISMVILTPFLQCWQDSGTLKFSYRRLCFYARDNNYLLLIAQVFVLLVGGGFYLLAAAADSVGISFFSKLFLSTEISPVIMMTAFGFGIALAREKQKMRELMSKSGIFTAHIILPIVTPVAIMLVTVLPLRQWNEMLTGIYYPFLFVAAAAIIITLINSVYLDGKRPDLWHGWRRFFAVQLIAILPLYGALMLFMAFAKYNDNGMSSARYWLFIAGFVTLAYGISYLFACIAQFNSGMGFIKIANKTLALTIAIFLPIAQIPPLDAISVTANMQSNMLIKGRIAPDKFDYGYLYFRLGETGKHELEKIEKHFSATSENNIVQREMTFARKSRNYWDWKFDWNIRKSQSTINNKGE